MSDINITYYNANDLVMAEYNPRQLTKDQYTQLKDSINRFGLVDPLIVNKNKDRKNILVGGHQRLRIAKEIGLESIPCVEIDLSYDQEKELNIRLNKNVGEWDYDALANHFDVGELTEWGFSNDELQFYEDEPTAGLIDDDEIPEVEEPITQTGDLWILGEHRLLCGDATKKEDVDLLMDGKKADMVFTDPPYGINRSGQSETFTKKKKHKRKLHIDKQWDSKIPFKVFKTILNMNVPTCIFGGNYFVEFLSSSMGWIYWDKGQNGLSMSDGELAWTNQQKALRSIICNRGNIGKSVHPTQKPLKVILFCLDFLGKGKLIIDLFLGSGSTLIACEKTNRKCYGMEIDPHYCDVIVKRWEEFSGKKAERVERAES